MCSYNFHLLYTMHTVKKRSPSAAVWGMGFSGAIAPCRNNTAGKKKQLSAHFLTKEKESRSTHEQMNQPTNKQTNKQANKQTNKQTSKQARKQASKPANQQASKQTNRHAQASQPTNQPTNQPSNQPTNQPTNKQTNKHSRSCKRIVAKSCLRERFPFLMEYGPLL